MLLRQMPTILEDDMHVWIVSRPRIARSTIAEPLDAKPRFQASPYGLDGKLGREIGLARLFSDIRDTTPRSVSRMLR